MAREKEDSTPGGISSEAARKATGRGWAEWRDVLDDAGAADWDHKEIVAYLEREHPEVESGWWRQSVTVAYELAIGKRVPGETTAGGFQVGVQRTVPLAPAQAWALLTGRPELWLGEDARIEFQEGASYEVPAGGDLPAASGEVRVVKPGDRLRMTWHPEGWEAPATLQLSLSEPRPGACAIQAHLEKLPDPDAREASRERWRGVLARIAAEAAGRG
jgi:uncharacterized protein YndB with AHSA1/START domain